MSFADKFSLFSRQVRVFAGLIGVAVLIFPGTSTSQADELYFAPKGDTILYGVDTQAGGSPSEVLDARGELRGVALEGDMLYWLALDSGTSLFGRLDLSGGSPQGILDTTEIAVPGPIELLPNGLIAWSDAGQGLIGFVDPDAREIVGVVETETSPHGLASDSRNLYWTDPRGAVFRAPLEDPGSSDRLLRGDDIGMQGMGGIAEGEKFLFVVADDGNGERHIFRMQKDGSDPHRIFGPATGLEDVDVVADTVYVTQTGSSGIISMDFDGGNASQPVSGIAVLAVAGRESSGGGSTAEVDPAVTSLALQGDPVVLDADASNSDTAYDRDVVKARGEVDYSRTEAGSPSGTFRIRYQLQDGDGHAVPVTGGDANEYRYTSSESITVSSSSPVTRAYDLRLDPDVRLDVNELYYVEIAVQELDGSWITHSDTITTTPGQTYYHFTNIESGDAAVNVIGDIGEVEWMDLSAVRTDPDKNSFEVAIVFDLIRYDDFEGPSGTDPIQIHIDYTLHEQSSGNAVELEQNQYSEIISVPRYATNSDGVTGPSGAFSINRAIEVTPGNGVQLDSVNETYYVRATLRHVEVPGQGAVEDETASSQDLGLLHFNGELHFDDVVASFTSISNDPVRLAGGLNYVTSTFAVDDESGSVPGHPLYFFGAGTNLDVRVFPDGHAEVTNGTVALETPPDTSLEEIVRETHNVRYGAGQIELGPDGANAGSIFAYLPHGFGQTIEGLLPNAHYLNFVQFSANTYSLDGDLAPDATVSGEVDTPPVWVMHEAIPLRFRVDDLSWTPTQGKFEFNVAAIFYNHQNALEDLETLLNEGVLAGGQAMATRPSNEGYFNFIDGMTGPLAVTAASDGTALLEADFGIAGSGDFQAHFPIGAEIEWNSPGSLVYSAGEVDPSQSTLENVSQVRVPYVQFCPDGLCGPVGSGVDFIDLQPDNNRLRFTPDGGLHAEGSLPNAKPLQWGAIGPEGNSETVLYAHETDNFSKGNFLMSGTFVASKDVPFDVENNTSSHGYGLGAGIIHFSGFDPNDLTEAERPLTSEYETGLADYPGMNFRVESSNTLGFSRLGGEPTDFLLTTRSKYYARGPGVTGIHEAQPGEFNAPPKVYGYDMSFTNYGLSFIASLNHESRTNGSITIPYPSNFKQGFDELKFTCLGALDKAKVPDNSGEKQLEYWLGEFQTLAISFESDTDDACSGNTYLALGAKTKAGYVEETLFGTMGFKSDGRLLALADGVDAATSRFSLPDSLSIEGPAKETYKLTPVSKLYFNNHDSHADGDGFVTFAGTVDVPFFEDLKVQVQTSAALLDAESESQAPLHLMGGWPDQGWTDNDGNHYFTNTGFDSDHDAYPAGTVALGDYRTPSQSTGDTYLPRARQSFVGVRIFDYPVQWNDTTRTFASWQTIENNLLVLDVEHQVDYMSAENVEISFGAKYDGLPRISLTNLAFNAVDEQLGVAEALVDATQEEVHQAIVQGLDQTEDLLKDQVHTLLQPLFDTIRTDALDPYYTQLSTSYNNARNAGKSWNNWMQNGASEAQEQYIHNAGTGRAVLLTRLEEIDDALQSSTSTLARVDRALARVQVGMSSFVDRVPLDGSGNIVVPGVDGYINADGELIIPNVAPTIANELDGILLPDGNGDRVIVQRLIAELVRKIAPPEVRDQLADALGNAASGMNEDLNALLEESEPTLQRIIAILNRVDETLGTVRESLKAGQDFQQEIADLVSDFRGDLVSLSQNVAGFATSRLDELRAGAGIPADQPLEDFPNLLPPDGHERFKERLEQEVVDLLVETELVNSIHVAIKQRLYDVNAVMENAIDSAFAQVNQVIRELISYALQDIDESIRGMAGDFGDAVGAGQIDGFAHIEGDALRKLRLDGQFEWTVPKKLSFGGYLEIHQLDSDGSEGCNFGRGATATEVKLGALDVPLEWISPGMRADVGTKFSFKTQNDVPVPQGMGGSFEMSGGTLNFETFEIFELGAAAAFGAQENYISATAGIRFNSYEASGGIYFGRTCTLEPIEMWDPAVAEVLPAPPLTGAYVYAEAWIPVSEAALGIPATCMFRLSAGMGAGAFYFLAGPDETPTYGGKILAGASGEALCVVSIKGEVLMIGVKSGNQFRFSGTGKVGGRVGSCPFCIKFSKNAKITYVDSWNISI